MFNKDKRVVSTKIGVEKYIPIVETIVAGYFDGETGVYQPHIGSILTLITFYNLFYKTEDEAYITDVKDASKIIENEDFMRAFDSALIIKGRIAFDFAHAYEDAMAVVDSKSQSIAQLVDYVKPIVNDMIAKLNSILVPDNIDNVALMAKAVSNGKLSVNEILKNYMESDDFKERTEAKSNKDKVSE